MGLYPPHPLLHIWLESSLYLLKHTCITHNFGVLRTQYPIGSGVLPDLCFKDLPLCFDPHLENPGSASAQCLCRFSRQSICGLGNVYHLSTYICT